MPLAEAAFASYRETTGAQRAAFLERIADEIMALGDDLIQRAHSETGLPEARLTGERGRTVDQLKLFAQVGAEGSWVDARIDTAIPDRQPVPKPDLRRMLGPHRPGDRVRLQQFPARVFRGRRRHRLRAGDRQPGRRQSAQRPSRHVRVGGDGGCAGRWSRASLPAGVFSMLHGSGKVIGTALVKHPSARAVGFTGSRAAGRALFDAAAARPAPIPVFAEMSSLNPIFLLPGSAAGARGENRRGVAQLHHDGRRPILHQARPGIWVEQQRL